MRLLSESASTDLAETDDLLVVPVGATEQHGPHLPLSTDTDIAVALARRLAAALPRIVVAPAIAYGASGEHQSFAGTLSIGQPATELVLVELGRSATETFRRVLLVSTHGGNARPVARAVQRLRAEGRDVRAWSPATAWPGNAHAGETETALMLALKPDLVRLDRLEAGNTEPLAALIGAMQAGVVAAVSPNGVLGDPRPATASRGESLLRDATRDLVAAARAWPAQDRSWL